MSANSQGADFRRDLTRGPLIAISGHAGDLHGGDSRCLRWGLGLATLASMMHTAQSPALNPAPPPAVNFIRVSVGSDYDGTNSTLQAAFVFEVDESGDGGALYYDSDPVDPGFTTIATLESGTVWPPRT